MSDSVDTLIRLEERLAELEHRVSDLEALSKPAIPLAVVTVGAPQTIAASEEFVLPQPTSVFPVLGKAMLGIAGAYVLRALAESAAFPRLVIVTLALAYACAWLVWAAWIEVGARFASTTYAATAALILAPMLVELTVRFRVLSAWVTAGLLGAFVVASCSLAWKRNLSPVVWVSVVTGVFTALGLMIASRNLLPYASVLLLMTLASEFSAARGRWSATRILLLPAVDFAVWTLISVCSLPESSRVEYTAVSRPVVLALSLLLFLICGTGTVFRASVLRHRATVFEIAQGVAAFVLAVLSWHWLAPRVAIIGFGVFCWLLAAVFYAAAFFSIDGREQPRNYYLYATWSAALVLTGSLLVLSPTPAGAVLSIAAIAVSVVGVRADRLTFGFQGLVYMATAAFVSGLLLHIGLTLIGTLPSTGDWMTWMVGISTLVYYAIVSRYKGEQWDRRGLRLASTLLAIGTATAFVLDAMQHLITIVMTPGAASLAVVRTFVICDFAVALAFSGTRWQRVELVWSAYLALAMATLKLLFEDLRHGHSESIAISLFIYAAALIIIPRMTRSARQQKWMGS